MTKIKTPMPKPPRIKPIRGPAKIKTPRIPKIK